MALEEKMDTPILYLVVPCYNEEEIITWAMEELKNKYTELKKQDKIAADSKVVFVNDGSKDKTREIIEEACAQEESFTLINFTKNFGHQNAILAGMLYSREYADAVITIDADLQQDINAIEEFVQKFNDGADIVYGVRNDRKTDGFFKKKTAGMFYGLMKLFGCNVIANSADYRLMSKRSLETLSQFTESNLFLRGLIPTMGYPSDIVYFDVQERKAGVSKYNLKKMLTLALDGITSLTISPIRFVTTLGTISCICALIMIIHSLVVWALGGTVPGYATTTISIWFVGGMTMLSQGIIGEYVGKTYFEVKKRPRYIVDNIVNGEKAEA
ncbi:MAG: glycosyltransferase family 2 protein [Lachnospiraceae bacterium]|nr:glycosyltransferase family 2 protein [Lachnospiraceae bacterium]